MPRPLADYWGRLLGLVLLLPLPASGDPRTSMVDDRILGALPPPPVLDFRLERGDWMVDEWTGFEGYSESGSGWRQPTDPAFGPTQGVNAAVAIYDRVYLRGLAGGATPLPLRIVAGLQVGYQILVGHLSDSSLTLGVGSVFMMADDRPAGIALLSGNWAKQIDRDLFSNGIVFRHGVLAAIDLPVPLWDSGKGLAPRVGAIRIGAGWQFQFNSLMLSAFLDGSASGNLRGLIGIGYRQREFGKPVTSAAQ